MPYSSRRQVELTNGLGLHLRAASRLVQLAQQFQSEVRVLCEGRTADGKSILDLMTLAAQRGSRLEIEACGGDAEEAIAALQDSLKPVSKSVKSLRTLLDRASLEPVGEPLTWTLPEARVRWTPRIGRSARDRDEFPGDNRIVLKSVPKQRRFKSMHSLEKPPLFSTTIRVVCRRHR